MSLNEVLGDVSTSAAAPLDFRANANPMILYEPDSNLLDRHTENNNLNNIVNT